MLHNDYVAMIALYGQLVESDLVPDPATLAEGLADPPSEAVVTSFEEWRPSSKGKSPGLVVSLSLTPSGEDHSQRFFDIITGREQRAIP